MSVEPLVRGALLKSGVDVDLVGAFKPIMWESDDDVMCQGNDVDTPEGAFAEMGGIVLAMKSGALDTGRIRAEPVELCQGIIPGRHTRYQITVFKSVGTGLEDVAAETMFYRRMGVDTA